jgi:hypothetical protein
MACTPTDWLGGGFLPPACDDGKMNGDETDVDCGGPSCRLCVIGDRCRSSSDCASGDCSRGTCREPHCSNLTRDQDEAGVDCGGTDCTPCASKDECTNGKQDESETDVDCGGLSECDRCRNGESCRSDDDCLSRVCTASVCMAYMSGSGGASGEGGAGNDGGQREGETTGSGAQDPHEAGAPNAGAGGSSASGANRSSGAASNSDGEVAPTAAGAAATSGGDSAAGRGTSTGGALMGEGDTGAGGNPQTGGTGNLGGSSGGRGGTSAITGGASATGGAHTGGAHTGDTDAGATASGGSTGAAETGGTAAAGSAGDTDAGATASGGSTGAAETGGTTAAGSAGDTDAGGTASGGSTGATGGCSRMTAPSDGIITDFSEFEPDIRWSSGNKTWGDSDLSGKTFQYPDAIEVNAAITAGGSLELSSTVPSGSFAGFVLAFDASYDAKSFGGLSFTVSGNLAPATLDVSLRTSHTTPIGSTCGECEYTSEATKWADCVLNTKTVTGVTPSPKTIELAWSDFTGGKPFSPVDPTELVGVQLQFWCSTDPSCTIDVIFDDFSFY